MIPTFLGVLQLYMVPYYSSEFTGYCELYGSLLTPKNTEYIYLPYSKVLRQATHGYNEGICTIAPRGPMHERSRKL